MTRTRVSLVTLGDPKKQTGGYLYHLRLAEAAPRRDQGDQDGHDRAEG